MPSRPAVRCCCRLSRLRVTARLGRVYSGEVTDEQGPCFRAVAQGRDSISLSGSALQECVGWKMEWRWRGGGGEMTAMRVGGRVRLLSPGDSSVVDVDVDAGGRGTLRRGLVTGQRRRRCCHHTLSPAQMTTLSRQSPPAQGRRSLTRPAIHALLIIAFRARAPRSSGRRCGPQTTQRKTASARPMQDALLVVPGAGNRAKSLCSGTRERQDPKTVGIAVEHRTRERRTCKKKNGAIELSGRDGSPPNLSVSISWTNGAPSDQHLARWPLTAPDIAPQMELVLGWSRRQP